MRSLLSDSYLFHTARDAIAIIGVSLFGSYEAVSEAMPLSPPVELACSVLASNAIATTGPNLFLS